MNYGFREMPAAGRGRVAGWLQHDRLLRAATPLASRDRLLRGEARCEGTNHGDLRVGFATDISADHLNRGVLLHAARVLSC